MYPAADAAVSRANGGGELPPLEGEGAGVADDGWGGCGLKVTTTTTTASAVSAAAAAGGGVEWCVVCDMAEVFYMSSQVNG